MHPVHPPITIALATYRGAEFLQTQLDSIAAQSDANWRLLVSDDGSDDATTEIAQAFIAQNDGRGAVIDGPRKGSTRNFLSLVRAVPADGWMAFADQDDRWLPDKLARAVDYLQAQKGPAVYAARTTICDGDLNVITPAPAFPGPFTFRNALIQACLPGNTIVVNAEALALLKEAAPAAEAAGIISHDWWVYQVLSGAGAAIMRDRAQVLLYRQHPRNLMGRNDTARAKAARFSMLTDGTFRLWLEANQRALEPVAHLFAPENRDLLRDFGMALQKPGPLALRDFSRMKLYRQSRMGTLAVYGAAFLGRLRSRNLAEQAG